jgi:hypothetical protein
MKRMRGGEMLGVSEPEVERLIEGVLVDGYACMIWGEEKARDTLRYTHGMFAWYFSWKFASSHTFPS